MNLLWSSMLLLGIVYGVLQGRMPEVTDGVIRASREAVVLAVSLVGVTGFREAAWNSIECSLHHLTKKIFIKIC